MTPTKTKIFNLLDHLSCGVLLTYKDGSFTNKRLADTYLQEIEPNKWSISIKDCCIAHKPILYNFIFNCTKQEIPNKLKDVMDTYSPDTNKDLGDYDSIDSVVWYNGYTGIIDYWNELAYNCLSNKDNTTSYLPRLDSMNYETLQRKFSVDLNDMSQLEVLWMVAVCKFGNYGTSPRSGWIENLELFREWCDAITQTREDYTYIETTSKDSSCIEVYTYEF